MCNSTGAPGTVTPRCGAGLLGVPGCLACRRAATRPQCCLQHRWHSGHRHALLWSRAAWRVGGRRPARSIACSTAGVPGTVTPNCGAGLLSVPAGGGPPASRPRRELRSVRRLEARPGPATAHRHHNQAPPAPPTPAVLGMLTYGLAHHPDTPPSPTTAHRQRSQAPHDFWYCYVASRVFQAPPAPSTPVALGMPTYGLAHHPDTPPSPTTTHRHRNQAPHDFWYCYVASRVFQAPTSPLHTSGARHADVRLAHHPEARVGTASTHRHGSRTPLPRCRLFLSGVTPFSWALHHFPGGVMLPNWCNAP